MTNSCEGIIPDLCQFNPCQVAPTPLQCSQSPAAGGTVGPGTHPITVTFTDSFQNVTQTCVVNFVVTSPITGQFALLCASNKTVECGTMWDFDAPTYTNACCPHPGSPSNGVTVTFLSTVTNGSCPEVITAPGRPRTIAVAGASCSQTVTARRYHAADLDCNVCKPRGGATHCPRLFHAFPPVR